MMHVMVLIHEFEIKFYNGPNNIMVDFDFSDWFRFVYLLVHVGIMVEDQSMEDMYGRHPHTLERQQQLFH